MKLRSQSPPPPQTTINPSSILIFNNELLSSSYEYGNYITIITIEYNTSFEKFTFPGRGIVCKTTTTMNFPTH
jgi:hypothetical protein